MPRVRDELTYVLENRKLNKNEIDNIIKVITESLEIIHLLDRHVDSLSMGEKQRVALASVFALEPDVLILDEPMAYLDPYASASQELINILNKLNFKYIIIAGHRLDRVIDFADRIIVIEDGRIIAEGNPHEVLDKIPPEVPKPVYMELGFKTIQELIEYVNSKRCLVQEHREGSITNDK